MTLSSGQIPQLAPSIRFEPLPSKGDLDWTVLEDPREQAAICRRMREDSGYSVSEMARRLGIDEKAVRAVESAQARRLALVTFVRWAAICKRRVRLE
jgi:hypothetical protein